MKKQNESRELVEKTNITVLTKSKKPFWKKITLIFKRMSLSQKISIILPSVISAIFWPSILFSPALLSVTLSLIIINLTGKVYFDSYGRLNFKMKKESLDFMLFKEDLKNKMLEMNSITKLSNRDYEKIYKVYTGVSRVYSKDDLVFRGSNRGNSMVSISVNRSEKLFNAFSESLETSKASKENIDNSEILNESKKEVLQTLEDLKDFTINETDLKYLISLYQTKSEKLQELDDYFFEFDQSEAEMLQREIDTIENLIYLGIELDKNHEAKSGTLNRESKLEKILLRLKTKELTEK